MHAPHKQTSIETAKLTQAGLNLIQQALSIYDRDLRLVACNRRFQEMFDLPEALVTPGATFEGTIRLLVERGEYGDLGPMEDAIRLRVDQARAFKPHYMERTRANGRTISVEGSPLPQGGWVAVYTDITEIKQQELLLRARSEELSDQLLTHAERLAQANRALAATNAALEEAQRGLREMEARTRLVSEMMPAHIAHIDADLRYTHSNLKLAAVMPGSPSDIIGLRVDDALDSASYARIEPFLDRALTGEASVFEITHGPSGHRVRIALNPDRRADGEVTGVYILSTNVTEETQARAALTQTAKRELAAQLTSGLAHDFANLLTIILGLQGRAQRLPDLPGEATDLIASTLAAARRGGTLLERIAAISGRRELRPAPTDLTALLAETQALAGPTLPDGLVLTHCIDGITHSLFLDAGSLQDALLNLVLNAKDAIGPNAGRIEITARPVRDTWLEISVDDTGPGFSDAALSHGLDPFFTTKGGEGSGLGLSMVYDQTKLAGGSTRLSNRPEGGARVVLRLPLRLVTAPARALMVLLVEDSDEIRADVRAMLRDMGHSVIEATSVDEALQLAELPGVDMILSDIGLQGEQTGVDLALALRATDHPAQICLMTSFPHGHSQRERARDFTVLTKPFTALDLASVLTTTEAA